MDVRKCSCNDNPSSRMDSDTYPRIDKHRCGMLSLFFQYFGNSGIHYTIAPQNMVSLFFFFFGNSGTNGCGVRLYRTTFCSSSSSHRFAWIYDTASDRRSYPHHRRNDAVESSVPKRSPIIEYFRRKKQSIFSKETYSVFYLHRGTSSLSYW